jgi:hypothetical protein
MIWVAGETEAEVFLNAAIDELCSDWKMLVATVVIGLIVAWANSRGWGRVWW